MRGWGGEPAPHCSNGESTTVAGKGTDLPARSCPPGCGAAGEAVGFGEGRRRREGKRGSGRGPRQGRAQCPPKEAWQGGGRRRGEEQSQAWLSGGPVAAPRSPCLQNLHRQPSTRLRDPRAGHGLEALPEPTPEQGGLSPSAPVTAFSPLSDTGNCRMGGAGPPPAACMGSTGEDTQPAPTSAFPKRGPGGGSQGSCVPASSSLGSAQHEPPPHLMATPT